MVILILIAKRLTDVADPVHDQDAATKKYVDDHISSDAASKRYVDDETLNKILLLIVKQKEMKYSFLTVLKV